MQTGDSERRIEIGADVIGKGQEKLGTVAYVVVRPPEMHITDIVVSTGALLGRDVVVPVEAVSGVADGKVHLSADKNQLQTYPDYVDIKYKQPPAGWVPPANFPYPTGGILAPDDLYYPQVASVEVNAPPGTVGLSEGMDVESSDGHKVGSIDAIEADSSTGDVTGFIVKHGILFKHDTWIPAADVAYIEADGVKLRLSKDEVERMEPAESS